MLIRSVVPRPSRTSSTLPPASATRRRASSSEAGSRIARRLARPDGMPGSLGSDSASSGGSADTNRGVGCRSANGRMTASACSKRSKLANRPCQSWRGSSAIGGPGDDPGRAVVVQVQLGVVAGDVDELGVGRGVDDVEGPHEPAAAVHHAVADRARPARAAGARCPPGWRDGTLPAQMAAAVRAPRRPVRRRRPGRPAARRSRRRRGRARPAARRSARRRGRRGRVVPARR